MTPAAGAPGPSGPETLWLEGSSGRVPLGFVRDGPVVHLVARERTARWPTEILRSGAARVAIGSERLAGRCRLRPPGPERDAILARFREKYGPRAYERWYAHPSRVVTIEVGTAAPSGSATDYYGWIEAEFDNIALEYDAHILGNRMNRLLRDRSLALLRPTFAGRRRLLEIGCGSGLETLRLLEDGHEVTAVDISRTMLEVVRGKAERAGCSERLATIHAPASAVPWGRAGLEEGGFDGGYSTYGAINCEPDLTPFRRTFAAALRPGAPLVLGVYNRWCLFETLAYGLTFRPERALGRRRNPVEVGRSRFCVDVFAYSIGDLRRTFGPDFRDRGARAVPLLLPPSDLTLYAERFARRFDRLARWDAWLGARAALAGWGDHFLLSLERRGDGVAEAGRAA